MEYEKCEFEIIFFEDAGVIVTSTPEGDPFDGEVTP